MRNLIIALILIAFNIACQKEEPVEKGYVIKAELANADSSMAYLMTRNDSWDIMDSTMILNGTFELKGSLEMPEMYYIRIGQSRRNMIPVFLENKNFNLKGNFDSLDEVNVEGGEMQGLYNSYKSGISGYDDRMKKLYEDYMIADSLGDMAQMSKIDSMWEDLDKEKIDYIKNYAFDNNMNVFGPYLTVSSELNYTMTLPEFEELYMAFDTVLIGSKYYIKLQERIKTLESIQVGNTMPSFSQADTSGKMISSDEFRGKYLLIDFWASWCGPCRRENPNVVAMYNELHDKGPGFEILGVSLDESKENWIQAIEADGLTWPHVSDLKGWSNEVAGQYGINSIPHTVLVDPDGKIIAHKLRGDELRSKLESLLIES